MFTITDLATVIVIGIAAYRITRLALFDTIIEQSRARYYTFVANRKWFPRIREKILDLTSCSWCLGFWVSLALYSLVQKDFPWNLGIKGWILTFAIAGVQGPLHAHEPGDEE